MIREVLVFPHVKLRLKCDPVTNHADRGQLFADLVETMFAKDGVGLAAPQIGETVNVFVLNVPYVERKPDGQMVIKATPEGMAANYQPLLFVNPKIISKSPEKDTDQEGCLSFPGAFAPIERHRRVVCKAENGAGVEFIVEAEGLYARAIQHEHDHLTGQLMIDLVGPVKREMIKNKMKKRG